MMLKEMINIKKLYYSVWVDAIKAAIKTNKDGQNSWKSTLLIIFSVSQGINLLAIFLLIKVVSKKEVNVFINFNLFPGKMLDSFLSAFITLFLPFLLLNYFLVFYKDKYKSLLDSYAGFKMKEGLLFMLYFIASMIILLLPVIIGKWII